MKRGEIWTAGGGTHDAGYETGLGQTSSMMVDKLTTMPRAKLDEHVGTVSDTSMLALSRALLVFLGLA